MKKKFSKKKSGFKRLHKKIMLACAGLSLILIAYCFFAPSHKKAIIITPSIMPQRVRKKVEKADFYTVYDEKNAQEENILLPPTEVPTLYDDLEENQPETAPKIISPAQESQDQLKPMSQDISAVISKSTQQNKKSQEGYAPTNTDHVNAALSKQIHNGDIKTKGTDAPPYDLPQKKIPEMTGPISKNKIIPGGIFTHAPEAKLYVKRLLNQCPPPKGASVTIQKATVNAQKSFIYRIVISRMPSNQMEKYIKLLKQHAFSYILVR